MVRFSTSLCDGGQRHQTNMDMAFVHDVKAFHLKNLSRLNAQGLS